ncbi:hypothetical protein ACP3WF_24035, partial [Salmonella enterica]
GILPSIPSDGAAAVGTAMAGEAIAQTVVPEMAAPEREGQASEPTPGNSKDAIVSDETAPEPETELRTALTLLLDHLQSRRDKAA